MNKNSYLIDSSAFIAINNRRDQYHDEAVQIAENIAHKRFVISDAIMNETYNILRYRLGYERAKQFLQLVLEDDTFVIYSITPSIRLKAFSIIKQFEDQKLSYCDALSAAIMKTEHIEKIFAFDHDFEVIGFQLLQ